MLIPVMEAADIEEVCDVQPPGGREGESSKNFTLTSSSVMTQSWEDTSVGKREASYQRYDGDKLPQQSIMLISAEASVSGRTPLLGEGRYKLLALRR